MDGVEHREMVQPDRASFREIVQYLQRVSLVKLKRVVFLRFDVHAYYIKPGPVVANGGAPCPTK